MFWIIGDTNLVTLWRKERRWLYFLHKHFVVVFIGDNDSLAEFEDQWITLIARLFTAFILVSQSRFGHMVVSC